MFKDNAGVNCICLDSQFQVKSKFRLNDLAGTIFKKDKDPQYIGGIVSGNKYIFLFESDTRKGLQGFRDYLKEEIVNFNSKSVSSNNLFEIKNNEHLMGSFYDNGSFYIILINQPLGELVFNILDSHGNIREKTVKLDLPAYAGKFGRRAILKYLNYYAVFSSESALKMEDTWKPTQLYSIPGKFILLVNKPGEPTEMITIDKKDFQLKATQFNFSILLGKKSRRKFIDNTLIYKDKLFVFISTKSKSAIGIYQLSDLHLIRRFDITSNTNPHFFNSAPVQVFKIGNKYKNKTIDMKEFVAKMYSEYTPTLSVITDQKGRCDLTIGTFVVPTGGGGQTYGGFQPNNFSDPTQGMHFNPDIGSFTSPSYLLTDYYRSYQIQLLLDTSTFENLPGIPPTPPFQQTESLLNNQEMYKRIAFLNFSVGRKKYFGYYDKQ
ncbi:MAG TPA: hypothetical protein VNE41_03075 [Chitinophagaceae bacterium]|nr:hypothetical protein [Chitinophagaceae bacterium]